LRTVSNEKVHGHLEYTDRMFQLWEYQIGMSRMLLRSTKRTADDTRIDLVFQGVDALKLPSVLPSLTLDIANAMQEALVIDSAGLILERGSRIFTLNGRGFEGYVIAVIAMVCVDDGEYFDASAAWF
jgi:hypothetical protein